MTFVSRRKPFTRNRSAVQMSGHARGQVPLRRAAKRGGSRRVRLRSLPERARPRFRAVAVVPRPSLPPRGASEQASAAGERPGAEPRSQRAWCRVPLPGGGDERREVSTCGLRSRWSCFRERCRKNGSCTNPRQSEPRSYLALASRSRAMPVPTGRTGQRSAFPCLHPMRVSGSTRSAALRAACRPEVGGPLPARHSGCWRSRAPSVAEQVREEQHHSREEGDDQRERQHER